MKRRKKPKLTAEQWMANHPAGLPGPAELEKLDEGAAEPPVASLPEPGAQRLASAAASWRRRFPGSRRRRRATDSKSVGACGWGGASPISDL